MKKNKLESRNQYLRSWRAFGLSLAIYALVFWIAEGGLGKQAIILALLPVFWGSWVIGIWGGVLSATLALLMSAFLFELKGYPHSWQILVFEGGAGSVSLYITSIVVGYLSYAKQRYEDAVYERVKVAERADAQASFLSHLVNITNEVLDADSLDSVLYVLAEETSRIFNAEDCLISLWDQASGTYYPRVAAGKEKEALENLSLRTENTELVLFQSADILTYGKITELSVTWQFLAKTHPEGSLLVLPLGAGGEKIGLLQLLYKQRREFPPDELTSAKHISRQISQSIWKLILLTQAEEQIEELSILHELAVVLPSAIDNAALMNSTFEILATSLYPDRLSILLFDKEGKISAERQTHSVEKNDAIDLIPLGRGITGRVAQLGVLERYDDVRQAPGYEQAFLDTRSEICVPIKVGHQVVGVINVESNRFATFDIRDERILKTVTNQMGVALKRLRAEQAQRERVAEIDRSNKLIHSLTEVATEMGMSSDPNAVMRQMGIELATRNWKILVALFEPGSQDLMIRYTSLDERLVKKIERFSNVLMQDFRIPLENLPNRLNLNEHLHPIIVDDYFNVIARVLQGFSVDTMRRIFKDTLDVERTVLGHFPLTYREKVLGFLWLWGEDLAEDDLPTLSVFANQVAATLENATLFADVQRLAITDGLTQLYTRRHFFETAYEEFYRARRYGHPLSVLMLDLDHFKQVNDTYGHAAGDAVLEKTADICRNTLRTNDIIGRYGGEEIVILLVETELDAAEQVAQRIWSKIRTLIVPTKKGDVHVTISIGVAGDNVEKMNLIEMIEVADQALYAAKENGRDRVEVTSLAPQVQDE